jgi:hypothetical protein
MAREAGLRRKKMKMMGKWKQQEGRNREAYCVAGEGVIWRGRGRVSFVVTRTLDFVLRQLSVLF